MAWLVDEKARLVDAEACSCAPRPTQWPSSRSSLSSMARRMASSSDRSGGLVFLHGERHLLGLLFIRRRRYPIRDCGGG
jgi:hypothetical protein